MHNNIEKYKSLLVIVVGLLLLHLWTKNIYLLYVPIGIGLISLIFPIVGDWILKAWFKIGAVLGFINTRILIGGIFFIFLTPFAWLQKLFTKSNFLSLKDSESTVFFERNHQYKSDDFENIF